MKAQLGLNALEVAGGAFIVIGILLGVGAYVLAQIQTQLTNTTAQNIVANTLIGVNTFGIWMPIIAVVIVAAIVLGIVLLTIGSRGGRGGAV